MTTQTHWNLINHHLVAKGDLSTSTLTMEVYQDWLRNWHTLPHPAKFPIATFRVEQEDQVLTVTIDSQSLSDYQPYHNLSNLLSGLEKLHLLQQSLDLATLLTTRTMSYHFDLSNLWIHPAGVCGWLPLPPHSVGDKGSLSTSFIKTLLSILGHSETPLENWQILERQAQLPWAWTTFIHDYLADATNPFPNKMANFRFLFGPAWLYLIANRLAMKDKLLANAEYRVLTQLGQQLGLNPVQMQSLDVIAQQDPEHTGRVERMDLLTLVALENASYGN